MEYSTQEIYDLLLDCSEKKDSRRWNRFRKDNHELRINLCERSLRKAMLHEFNLSNIDFTNCDMRNAKLQNANLKGANLTQVNLANAILKGANLQNSNRTDTNFQMVKLDKNTRF